jgi:hypothetical protein
MAADHRLDQGEGALMERGPVALFGAIVAVGLGPAMWLGAQFGSIGATPSSPPAVSSQLNPSQTEDRASGGGAGAAPDNPQVVLRDPPRGDQRPVRAKTVTSPSPSVSIKRHPSTPASTPTTTAPAPSRTPSTESTSTPSGQPTGGSSDPGPGGGGPAPSPPPTGTDGGTLSVVNSAV